MPRYYVDFQDNKTFHRDDEGSDLPDAEAARREAITMLSQIAHDELPDGEQRSFIAMVRAPDASLVYRATLTFQGQWLR